ncbi:hypothetical protein KIN20_024751 [Parelaphostrongylus tenuis]|uniref:Uncharacterized protein n=1 Tax=Parelaphostrongylus tenuis TaxID=148309 RepID=A0AAD5NBE0_PARTN|nr:hypothetical protein KIN20_024751 [Parelaphostrongylus tenuis]
MGANLLSDPHGISSSLTRKTRASEEHVPNSDSYGHWERTRAKKCPHGLTTTENADAPFMTIRTVHKRKVQFAKKTTKSA